MLERGTPFPVPLTLSSLTMNTGWRFPTKSDTDLPGENAIPDPVPGHESFTHLRDIYFSVEPNYAGRFTVPTLYDKIQHKIVSNESSEIIRMFYHEFDHLLAEEFKVRAFVSRARLRKVVIYADDLLCIYRTSTFSPQTCKRKSTRRTIGRTMISTMGFTSQASQRM